MDLRATRRCSVSSKPAKTSPMPPDPSAPRIRMCPSDPAASGIVPPRPEPATRSSISDLDCNTVNSLTLLGASHRLPVRFFRALMGERDVTEIATIGVVGAGTMGHGIAQVAAVAGYRVVLVDVAP